MDTNRKYPFAWSLLGNIEFGRPNLGHNARLEVYRLMQYTFRDVIEQKYGTQAADDVFYEAGKMAGGAFYTHAIGSSSDPSDFIGRVQSALKEMRIGILRVEKADLQNFNFILTVAEDLDCSGLPDLGIEVCKYDEGFLAALLESYFQREFKVDEVDCWCTGDRTCRFTARLAYG